MSDTTERLIPATRADGPIALVEYDPSWPQRFEAIAADIRGALGPVAVRVEHTGSTSVPGLAAKPIIDITLAVPDSRAEAVYVPPLEAIGYVLALREPDWHEHRLLKGADRTVNLHVFSAGNPEIERMVTFRDWLHSQPADRELYERTKRELAARHWEIVQDYADAKTAVVEEILARAIEAARSRHPKPDEPG